MDTTRLVAVIRQELESHTGVASLQLQNHLYGCVIVLEDIARGILTYSEGRIVGAECAIRVDGDGFGQIGIRYYGFLMDGKAVLAEYSEEYKEEWLRLFQEVNLAHNMDEVDALEDVLIGVLQETEGEEGFFMNAMAHDGSLSPDGVEKALALLHPTLSLPALPALPALSPALALPSLALPALALPVSPVNALSSAAIERLPSRTKSRLTTRRRADKKIARNASLSTTRRAKAVSSL